MKLRKLMLSVVFLCIFGLSTLKAQVAVPAAGSNASGNGGTVSYSIGQVVYQTYTGTNASIAEGIQQPYEIFVVTGIEQAKSINLLVSAYPNPAKDYLTLNISDSNPSVFSFQLYGMDGRILLNEKITESLTIIPVSNFVTATYFLKVTRDSQEIKTFKIIKN